MDSYRQQIDHATRLLKKSKLAPQASIDFPQPERNFDQTRKREGTLDAVIKQHFAPTKLGKKPERRRSSPTTLDCSELLK
jgi:hypothetical protein